MRRRAGRVAHVAPVVKRQSKKAAGLAGGVAWAPAADLPPFPDRSRRGAGAAILAFSGAIGKGHGPLFKAVVIANGQSGAILIGRLHQNDGHGRFLENRTRLIKFLRMCAILISHSL
jgi:hypothetical protein